ncbi:2-C-methyl-D-erythritol 4-phosphate cytidylyltransferase [Clostridium frigidicarnis]|uniref:2-C-methyl-D-erythritol 4-phosphate cytidylyltransferase n=1 Tax=Clostridium frigidicarnis TaxID=84698 RepID=A0A1I1A9W2_9CLOT|nr:2-C-methyl-D-erythritol 4-phosphate cytidylyltransferase [Clostridium frigidicarnis]SFB34769.1 2-C-methyl-D-erythritol 4-phosphate cytidylyltransferase [Clostridium frigidicarnis]
MIKNSVVIVAGGKGTRMGEEISKQFLEIDQNPILYYTIKAFEDCNEIDEIIVVIGENDINYFNNNIKDIYKFKKLNKVVYGGKERQNSVYNGLKACENCEIVLIHDGARPFVSRNIIKKGIEFAKKYGASACGVMPKDTIKVKDKNGLSINTLKRSELVAVQTPQCFKYELIMKAHDYIQDNDIQVTDDTMAVELLGKTVYLYEGDYTNIKITTPEDLILANYLVK